MEIKGSMTSHSETARDDRIFLPRSSVFFLFQMIDDVENLKDLIAF